MIGILTIHLHLPACASLKEKRSRLTPLMARLRRIFNLSVAEMGRQDQWQEALLGCAMMSNEASHLQAALQTVTRWVEGNWPDGMVVDQHIELI